MNILKQKEKKRKKKKPNKKIIPNQSLLFVRLGIIKITCSCVIYKTISYENPKRKRKRKKPKRKNPKCLKKMMGIYEFYANVHTRLDRQ